MAVRLNILPADIEFESKGYIKISKDINYDFAGGNESFYIRNDYINFPLLSAQFKTSNLDAGDSVIQLQQTNDTTNIADIEASLGDILNAFETIDAGNNWNTILTDVFVASILGRTLTVNSVTIGTLDKLILILNSRNG